MKDDDIVQTQRKLFLLTICPWVGLKITFIEILKAYDSDYVRLSIDRLFYSSWHSYNYLRFFSLVFFLGGKWEYFEISVLYNAVTRLFYVIILHHDIN